MNKNAGWTKELDDYTGTETFAKAPKFAKLLRELM